MKSTEPHASAKGRVSREKILAAARRVFSRHPYRAASLRMIGREGKFEHPLIRYYFPTKAALFEAVLEGICADLDAANKEWFSDLDSSSLEAGLCAYIDRVLEYAQKNPEPFAIMFLNMASVRRAEELPGIQLIPKVIAATKRTCEEYLPFMDSREHDVLNNVFSTLVISYLGAKSCQAMMLGMDPDGEPYRQWVRQALISVFLPWVGKFAPQP